MGMAALLHRPCAVAAFAFAACPYTTGSPTTMPTTVVPAFPTPPDTRPSGCESQALDPGGQDFEGLKVSIIIPYRRETWDHIRGSMGSILRYTPRRYIEEIMFVSDGNGPEDLYTDQIRALSPLVSMLVLPSVGLISAKMRAVAATSPGSTVLVFLEPHIRVNRMWLEPLLHRIRKYPRSLVMPVLDNIPQDNFDEYFPSSFGHWRFEWNLNLVYSNPTGQSVSTSEPWSSPATSGGIFAIRKDWWNTLGLYDHGMVGWGGDHVEATMKVWRCGGHIDVVPCSRIGHLFRDPDHRPYNVEIDQVVFNYARLAHVWFDEDIEYFYKMKPEARELDVGNLTELHALRESLHCKSMSWYLQNVDREMLWEKDRICIPGCSRAEHGEICCEDEAAFQRSTIDRTISANEYVPVNLPDILREHAEL